MSSDSPLTVPWSVCESLCLMMSKWHITTVTVRPKPSQLLLLLVVTHHVRKSVAGVYECSTEHCWIWRRGGNLFSALTFGLKLGRLKGFATGTGSSMLGGGKGVGIFCCVGDFGGRHHMRWKRPFGGIGSNWPNLFLLQGNRNACALL